MVNPEFRPIPRVDFCANLAVVKFTPKIFFSQIEQISTFLWKKIILIWFSNNVPSGDGIWEKLADLENFDRKNFFFFKISPKHKSGPISAHSEPYALIFWSFLTLMGPFSLHHDSLENSILSSYVMSEFLRYELLSHSPPTQYSRIQFPVPATFSRILQIF